MNIADALIQEIDREAVTTRRVLERVPSERLSWKPHPKSMSLGELAQHLATNPGLVSAWALQDVYEFSSGNDRPEPATSTAAIIAAHDQSVIQAKEVARQLGDAGLMCEWEAKMNGASVFKMPKVALYRSIVLNHWYHHRGQLSVYLRLLDVPVPSIYGPSADENPFAAQVS